MLASSWRPSLVLALLLAASPARAQIDCDTPDDLCTGDPCVVGSVEVDDSCVLDFGTRTVVVAGTVRLPRSGELSITAGAIQITGSVQNFVGPGTPGPGPRITFDAAGDINAAGSIRLVGIRLVPLPGAVIIRAAGNLTASNVLTASTSPTSISYEAMAGNIDFSGRINTRKPGGALSMTASGAIFFSDRATLRRQEEVQLTAGGNVSLQGRLIPRASFTVDAGGSIGLRSSIRALGADVALRGAAGVQIVGGIMLIPPVLNAGSLELISSAGYVRTEGPLRALDIRIQANDLIQTLDLVSASPPARSGGTIEIESATSWVECFDDLRAYAGTGTDPGDGAGGHVRLSGTRVNVTRDVLVNASGRAGAPGGTVELDGTGEVSIGPFTRVVADGDTPGSEFPGAPPAGLRATSSFGEINVWGGAFHVRGGPSVIQLTAAADIYAAGEFRVAPNGCLGVSGGGSVFGPTDYDTPPVALCP